MQSILRDEMDVVQKEWQEMHKKQPDKNLRGIGFFKRQVISIMSQIIKLTNYLWTQFKIYHLAHYIRGQANPATVTISVSYPGHHSGIRMVSYPLRSRNDA